MPFARYFCIFINVGLGEGSALPVGVPVPWPSATPPTGWLKCNGAPFAAENYPKLALVYPGLVLPDLRGEFIRGWDDGRGVDSGRALLSAQGDAIRNINGAFTDVRFNSSAAANGAFTMVNLGQASSDSAGTGFAKQVTFNASNSVPTASENRPRNIAFNYIVRAV
ncbi:putative variable tail fiber protein from prophage (fragment) [Escherichia coli]|uniref:phage tail protein n=1 Tax=Escherichia coli TaxID=562 RepID=UPI000DA5B177